MSSVAAVCVRLNLSARRDHRGEILSNRLLYRWATPERVPRILGSELVWPLNAARAIQSPDFGNVPDHSGITHLRNQENTGGHRRTRGCGTSSTGGHLRNRGDTGGRLGDRHDARRATPAEGSRAQNDRGGESDPLPKKRSRGGRAAAPRVPPSCCWRALPRRRRWSFPPGS